ncbi:uncharacterized protein LOC9320126 isoform X3 [Arabidopsis lyrata subsp. lyrata]|uniref:uncharacterized protein LOC9320126 isoform X3 n=1 Tax=Arabidopsis lyrata subsp. lyrata TaxID=81972 RepID=UPI000A29A762|nr:uncharacterized protein LOC9320126 isoform X3 [Arabidopsis lyrata subsp. lyrata]XP_020889270.1 uncharacterized protein LOC9320126 isoform X3 [Arabidopsis lyrata subsp. lyrata]|eukprot:XP_020889269.1 uncharacterized protein LOC9320126 isoform X3 [Arabidopsis lyrata subsp. lyrata]
MKGIFGRAFANAPIFALGYFTNDALTPNLNKKIKQVEQVLAKAESLGHTYKAELAKVEKREKIVNRLIQRCEVLLFELEKKEKKLDDLGKLYRAPRMDVLKEKEKKLDYLGQLYRAPQMDVLKEKETKLDYLGQLYRAPRMDVLKEMKNADGRYAGRN